MSPCAMPLLPYGAIYFHRNSLVGADFDQLDPGMEVKYVEEQGQEGPQAITVTLNK